MNDNIPRHDMAKIREAFAVGVCQCSDCVDFRRPLADTINELELLRRNEQLAANFAARADEVRKAAQVVVRAKAGPDSMAFKMAVSTLLTAVLGPEVWRDGEIARDGTQGLAMEEETKP